jgi:hypothetical protein
MIPLSNNSICTQLQLYSCERDCAEWVDVDAYAWPCCGHLVHRPAYTAVQSAVASRVPAPAADTPNRCTQLAAIKQAASAAGKGTGPIDRARRKRGPAAAPG